MISEKGERERQAALCWNVLVLQFHYSLYSPVIVVQVDGADHFGAFQVTNLHCDFADGVTANELDNLLCGGVARVHFDRWQFYILENKHNNVQSSVYASKVLQTPPPCKCSDHLYLFSLHMHNFAKVSIINNTSPDIQMSILSLSHFLFKLPNPIIVELTITDAKSMQTYIWKNLQNNSIS